MATSGASAGVSTGCRAAVFPAGGLVLDATAVAVADAIAAEGGTMTLGRRVALSDFFTAEKAANRWASFKRFHVPGWGVADANALDWVSLALGTYTGAPTHGAGFIKGNTTNIHFDCGTSLSAQGITTASAYQFALVKAAPSGTVKAMQGVGAGANDNTLRHDTPVATILSRMLGSGTGQISGASTAGTGIISMSRHGGDRSIYQRQTAGRSVVATNTSANSGTVPTANVYFLAKNNTDAAATPTQWSDAEFGAYGFGMGLSPTDDEAFTANLKTLWETLFGLTLP